MDKDKGKDYTKVCWSCSKKTMKPHDTYFQCSKCGATYVLPVRIFKATPGVSIYESKGKSLPNGY